MTHFDLQCEVVRFERRQVGLGAEVPPGQDPPPTPTEPEDVPPVKEPTDGNRE